MYVCTCVCMFTASYASLLAISRRILNCSTVCDFLCSSPILFSDDFLVLRERVLSSSWAFLHAIDVDLKVGRFLVSLIPAEDVL